MSPATQAVTSSARLETLEARITASLDAAGMDIGTCILAARLVKQGWKFYPPLWVGMRPKFVSPSGEVLYRKEILRRARAVKILKQATCERCGERIPISAYTRHSRGPRTDRRYCSDRCRQAAYRARKGPTKLAVTATEGRQQ